MINNYRVSSKEKAAAEAKKRGMGLGNVQNDTKDRLPPRQVKLREGQFLVLDLGYQPDFHPEDYRFRITGLIDNPINYSWEEVLNKLPKQELTADFHCVTRWSQFDVKWAGFSYLDLEKLIKPKENAKHVIQYGLDGYTTNVPIEDMRKDNVLFAYEMWGKPLEREHGWPLRMIIPELYGWKGSKFLTRIDFVEEDEPGFWEVRGYHNHGDPWKEERYS